MSNEIDSRDAQIIVNPHEKVVNIATGIDSGNSEFSFADFLTGVRKYASTTYILEKIHDKPTFGTDNVEGPKSLKDIFSSFWNSKSEPIVEVEQDKVLEKKPVELGLYEGARKLFLENNLLPEYNECITTTATYSLLAVVAGIGTLPDALGSYKTFKATSFPKRFALAMSFNLLCSAGLGTLIHKSCEYQKKQFVNILEAREEQLQ